MIALRNENKIFIDGDFEPFYIDDVFGFKRSLKDEIVFVLVNPTGENRNTIVPGTNKEVVIAGMSYEIVQI
ncbi:MAG: hypothetical protein GX154_10290 [Clostridiales bacterium]|nr:hypothetical protein [Clostridiales bacterium]